MQKPARLFPVRHPSSSRFAGLRRDGLFTISQEAHEACPLDGCSQHFLILERHAAVVAVTDIAEVIDVRLKRRVVFVVDILSVGSRKRAALLHHLPATVLFTALLATLLAG